MTTDTSETLLGIAERESFGPLRQAHAFMRTQVELAVRLDAIELETVFQHLAGGGVLMPGLHAQGSGLAAEAMALLTKLDERMEQFRACVSTPPRTAALGRSWLREIDAIDEMIQSAEKLMDLPSWQGSAAEAHLAVVPEQVEAMRGLRGQAITAADAVMAVGALQNLIFQSCTLVLIAAATQVEVHHPGAYVPDWLYKRTAGAIGLLMRVLLEIDKQISGEGTWLESALELSRGLEAATLDPDGDQWPSAVDGGGGKRPHRGRQDDENHEDDVEAEAEVETAEDEQVPVPVPEQAHEAEHEAEAEDEPIVDEPAEEVPVSEEPAAKEPVPEPVVQPEPVQEVILPSFAEAGIQQPYQPVDPVVSEQAWEQIAAERALAEEALLPSPKPAPIDGPLAESKGPLGVSQQLR